MEIDVNLEDLAQSFFQHSGLSSQTGGNKRKKNKEVVPNDLSNDELTLQAFKIKKFKTTVHHKTKKIPQVNSSDDADDDFMDSPENWARRNNKAKVAEAVLRSSPRVLSNKAVEEVPTLGDWVNNIGEPQKNKVAEQTKAVDNVLKNITESVSISEVVMKAMKKLKGSKVKHQVTPSSLVRNLGNRRMKRNLNSAYKYDLRKKKKYKTDQAIRITMKFYFEMLEH